jgi:hypothetical protein
MANFAIYTFEPREEDQMPLPKVSPYGDYSDNYGTHALRVDLGNLELWYSYDTIIAYRDVEDGMVICENVWGTTTGKHLNWINLDHKRRVFRDVYLDKLRAALARHIK